MSALRDSVEMAPIGGAALLSVHRRLDALLVATADLYEKLHAVALILGDDGSNGEELRWHFEILLDDEHASGIREARARLEAHSPEALEKFLREKREAKLR